MSIFAEGEKVSKKKKEPLLIISEKTTAALGDQKRAADRYYKKKSGSSGSAQLDRADIEEQLYHPDLTERERDSLQGVRSGIINLQNEARNYASNLPGMFDSDQSRASRNKFINETYDVSNLYLTDDPVENKRLMDSAYASYPAGSKVNDAFLMHSGRTIGGVSMEDIKKAKGDKEGCSIFGMCDAEKYAPYWAEGLGKDIIAQDDAASWSGTNIAAKTLENFFFYDYDDKTKKRSKVYKP